MFDLLPIGFPNGSFTTIYLVMLTVIINRVSTMTDHKETKATILQLKPLRHIESDSTYLSPATASLVAMVNK